MLGIDDDQRFSTSTARPGSSVFSRRHGFPLFLNFDCNAFLEPYNINRTDGV